MKDTYPRLDALPAQWLVEPGAQPDYLDIPGVECDESLDLGSLLCDAHVARGHGEDIAVIHHESRRSLTFAELAAESDRVAAALHGLGVRPGARVAVRGPNCPEFLVVAIAAWKIGAVVALIPALARVTEMGFVLDDTEPQVVVLLQPEPDEVLARLASSSATHIVSVDPRSGVLGWDDLLARTAERPKVAVDLDRVAIVWHTGGTTGRPKGCYHTQRRFALGGMSLGVATDAVPGQRWAAAAPMGHALGFIHSTNFTLQNGVTLVQISQFTDPGVVLAALAEHEVTQFTAIAASWGSMLALLEAGNAPEPSALRRGYAMWQSSSATEVSDGWLRRGVELRNNFGSTAFATWALVPPPAAAVPRASLGVAAPGYEVLAIDTEAADAVEPVAVGTPGRMAVRGPTGLTYWRLPELQRRDVRLGYTLQDDLIVFDGEGRADYLGRTDFMISTAGNKVAPVEIEAVLGSHPAVREAVVLGLPDPVRQEIVAAFVVLRDDSLRSDALRKELQDLVKSRLAPYKYPRRLDFIDALPRDNVGKVQPRLLKERVLASEGERS